MENRNPGRLRDCETLKILVGKLPWAAEMAGHVRVESYRFKGKVNRMLAGKL